MSPWIRAFAPATVSNVNCGFDVFGFALAGMGDVVAVRRTAQPGVQLREIQGDAGRLSRDPTRNTATVAAAHLLQAAGQSAVGVELRLFKGMPLASGMGSSAASGVAAAVAVTALLDLDLPRAELLAAAVEGERMACGSAHADNAAPSLFGGFVLVRPAAVPPVVSLPVPPGLTTVVLKPDLEVNTGEARALLGEHVALRQAVVQWGNAAALVAGLFRNDHQLIASALVDVVAEPVRAALVPGLAEVRRAALRAHALGCGLSGSGPSIFALCSHPDQAPALAAEMVAAMTASTGRSAQALISPVGAPGARVLLPGEEPWST